MNIQKFNRFKEAIHLHNRSISIEQNPALSRSPVSKALVSSGFSMMRIYSRRKLGQGWTQDAVTGLTQILKILAQCRGDSRITSTLRVLFSQMRNFCVRWQGFEELTCKTGQGDRPDPSNPRKVPGIPVSPGWNGNPLNSLGQSTWGRITPPSSAIILDLSGDVQVCSA